MASPGPLPPADWSLADWPLAFFLSFFPPSGGATAGLDNATLLAMTCRLWRIVVVISMRGRAVQVHAGLTTALIVSICNHANKITPSVH